MKSELDLKNPNPLQKEFQNLLNEDFKNRKLKENAIINATITEITKNFVVVDCKAKMEGMIPIEEFKNDEEFSTLKVGSILDIYLERIESFIEKIWQLKKLKTLALSIRNSKVYLIKILKIESSKRTKS